MKYTYDPMADAINITLKRGRVSKTHEVAPGVMLDFDKKGVLLYVEILDASRRLKNKNLGEIEFEPLHYSRKEARELVGVK